MRLHFLPTLALGTVVAAWPFAADAAPQLQFVFGGSAGTVVFIHGHSDCSTAMTDCSGANGGAGPAAYWTNNWNGANMINEATTRYTAAGAAYYEAFAIGYDLKSQGFWYAANDVGACLQDLYQGTNNSGCNPNRYQRTYFHIVTHSAGADVVDRLLSTGWYGVRSHVVGNVVSISGTLAGSRAASALYGVDGYNNNFCTTLVSWLNTISYRSTSVSSLTRGSVIGEANKGYAGRSPIWVLKVTTTGGSGSANNSGSLWGGVQVNEHDNDLNLGTLAGCLGYSSADDTDGMAYWSDTDPTNNTAGNGCPSNDHSCQYYPQFTGYYWHWFESWANHSHSRDDAYTTLGDWQSTAGCYFRSPGTCVGQYGLN